MSKKKTNHFDKMSHGRDDFPIPFDEFEDSIDESDYETMEMLRELSYVSRQHAKTAIDLVRLIVDHHEKGALSPDEILSLYKKTLDQVTSFSPLQKFVESQENFD